MKIFFLILCSWSSPFSFWSYEIIKKFVSNSLDKIRDLILDTRSVSFANFEAQMSMLSRDIVESISDINMSQKSRLMVEWSNEVCV